MGDIIKDAVYKVTNLEAVLNESRSLYEDAIECVCKIEDPKKDNLIRCPHCGESYYMENGSTCTAMYFTPIYKDGVNINPDRNITTTHCICMNCGKNFKYKL